MAINALTIQMNAAAVARNRKSDAVRQRDNLGSLVTAASFTYEAKRLASANLGKLRPLLERAGGKEDLLHKIGQLCAGKHPANEVLERARNSLGFHWDYEDNVIGAIVDGFANNPTIVWVEETATPSETVHRLAFETLAQGLFPQTGVNPEPTEQQQAIEESIRQVLDAMGIIAEFFNAAVVRYLRECDVGVRTRPL
jgi:hypothetical protein